MLSLMNRIKENYWRLFQRNMPFLSS